MNQELIDAMADLDDDVVLEIVQKSMDDGVPAGEILSDLQVGINTVGDRFSKGEYFLPELMLSGQLFKETQALLGDAGKPNPSNLIGTAIIGTVKADVHDIGKNIVVSVFESNGFNVVDLGVDCEPEAFVQAIRDTDAKIIGMSCLLTTTFEGIKRTVEAVEAAGLREGRLLLIGGGPVDETTLEYSNADVVCKTAQDGVIAAREFLAKRTVVDT